MVRSGIGRNWMLKVVCGFFTTRSAFFIRPVTEGACTSEHESPFASTASFISDLPMSDSVKAQARKANISDNDFVYRPL